MSDAAAARAVSTRLPTGHARFDLHGYLDTVTGAEHVALTLGDLAADVGPPPLVGLHPECLTGDALGSWRCDCGERLEAALAAVAAEGRGAVVYLRGHEGRSTGLLAQLRAYALQDRDDGTLEADLAPGHPVGARDDAAAAAVLVDLGVRCLRLLSSDPAHDAARAAALHRLGVEVEASTPLVVPTRPASARSLGAEQEGRGRDPLLSGAEAWEHLLAGRVPTGPLDDDAVALVDRYAPLLAAGPDLVIAQLAQSLDGFIAGLGGGTPGGEPITGDAERVHLHRLRALADAVVVGVGTVVADDPRLSVREVPGPSPVRVVLDPRARAPRGAVVLTDGAAPTLWCVGAAAAAGLAPPPHVEVVVLPTDAGVVAPADLVAALGTRGLRRVLVEGGGTTVSRFLAAGGLDRLWLSTAPLLVGDGVPGVRFPGADRLAGAVRAPSRRFLLGEDTVIELDLAAARAAAQAVVERARPRPRRPPVGAPRRSSPSRTTPGTDATAASRP